MRDDGSTRHEWQSFWEQKRRQVFTPASASGGPQLTPFKQEVTRQRIEGTTSPSLWPPPHLHLSREGMRLHLLGTVKPSSNPFKIQRIGSQKWISSMESNPWACDSEQQGLAAGQRDSDNGWIRSTISVWVGWRGGGTELLAVWKGQRRTQRLVGSSEDHKSEVSRQMGMEMSRPCAHFNLFPTADPRHYACKLARTRRPPSPGRAHLLWPLPPWVGHSVDWFGLRLGVICNLIKWENNGLAYYTTLFSLESYFIFWQDNIVRLKYAV